MMTPQEKTEQYHRELRERGTLPAGFRAGTTSFRFTAEEIGESSSFPMTLSLIALDEPTEAFAALFTRNAFAGAPVLIGRRLLDESLIQGVLINNKIANVGMASGEEDACGLCRRVEEELHNVGGPFFPSSTGVIGWRLPVSAMSRQIPALVSSLQSENLFPVAQGIMTTDAFPKLRSRRVAGGRITAVAKGAGMIEPDMATMLGFILTDIAVSRATLRRWLREAAGESFNRISVDGDQSTSDTVMAFSSGRIPLGDEEEVREAFFAVCRELAADIVRNGEGTGHVIRLSLTGAEDSAQALALAKGIINSPLVKTAIAGNDPNVGRLMSALGDAAGSRGLELDRHRIVLKMGNEVLYSGGGFQLEPEKEERLRGYLRECSQDPAITGYPQHDRSVALALDLGRGPGSAEVWGSDLTHEYVTENAEYRT